METIDLRINRKPVHWRLYVHYTGRDGTHSFATGSWRVPGNNSNMFARESRIDIMAAKLGMDP
jgi:hypothetical protein